MSEVIPLSVPNVGALERRYLDECLSSGFVSSAGPFVSRFEEAFASCIAAPHAVACASGTAAIHVALVVAGVERGDEVAVSDFSFIATANPVTYVGATPVFVDSDDKTWNMDAVLLSEELDRRASRGLKQPKAVLLAHVLGLAADVDAIGAACARHGVLLIEDAAEALGVTAGSPSRQLGTFGRLGCFSFNGNKIMTTGGGGAVTTADRALALRARHLTTQAKLPGAEYLHDEIGYNYRLTSLGAALGLAQLERLPEFLARKRAIAVRYDAALHGVPGVTLPPRMPWSDPSMWLYSVLIDPEAAGRDRRAIAARLETAGIQTRPLWAPAHIMPFYAQAPRVRGSVGERLFDRGLSLPCSTSLTEADQERVIDAFVDAVDSRRH